ncbi:MAG: PepSY domain-containing protein, partial [Planctomycetota bacterium]
MLLPRTGCSLEQGDRVVARLLVVCAAEAALVVLLAVQVFAGREPAAPRSGTGAASASQGHADPAATMTPGSPPTP